MKTTLAQNHVNLQFRFQCQPTQWSLSEQARSRNAHQRAARADEHRPERRRERRRRMRRAVAREKQRCRKQSKDDRDASVERGVH